MEEEGGDCGGFACLSWVSLWAGLLGRGAAGEGRTGGDIGDAVGDHAAAVGGEVAFAYRHGVARVEPGDVGLFGFGVGDAAADAAADAADADAVDVVICRVYYRAGWGWETSGRCRVYALAGLAEDAAEAAAVAICRAS